jgi:hypothetical protein
LTREKRVEGDKFAPPKPGEAKQGPPLFPQMTIPSMTPNPTGTVGRLDKLKEAVQAVLYEKEAALTRQPREKLRQDADPGNFYKAEEALQQLRTPSGTARSALHDLGVDRIYGDPSPTVGPLAKLSFEEGRELSAYLVARRELSDFAIKKTAPFFPPGSSAQTRLAENQLLINRLGPKYEPYANRVWDLTRDILESHPEIDHFYDPVAKQRLFLKNPHYVPFAGEMSDMERGSIGLLGLSSPTNRVGANNLLRSQNVLPPREPANPLEFIQQYTEGVHRKFAGNRYARSLADLTERGLLPGSDGWKVYGSQDTLPTNNVLESARIVPFRRNGEVWHLAMPAEAAAIARGLNGQQASSILETIARHIAIPTKMQATGLGNPLFELKQNIWSLPVGLLFARDPAGFLVDTVRAFPAALRARAADLGVNTPNVRQTPAILTRRKMMAGGVPGSLNLSVPEDKNIVGALFHSAESPSMRADVAFGQPFRAMGRGIVGRTLTGKDLQTLKQFPQMMGEFLRRAQDVLSSGSEAFRSGMQSSQERWWRKHAREIGGDPNDAEAARAFGNWWATNTFTNFNQRGLLVPMFELMGEVYANPAAQGATSLTRALRRGFKEHPIAMSLKMMAIGTALGVLPTLFNLSDPTSEDTPQGKTVSRRTVYNQISPTHQKDHAVIVVNPNAGIDPQTRRHRGVFSIPIAPELRSIVNAFKLFTEAYITQQAPDPISQSKLAQSVYESMLPMPLSGGKYGKSWFNSEPSMWAERMASPANIKLAEQFDRFPFLHNTPLTDPGKLDAFTRWYAPFDMITARREEVDPVAAYNKGTKGARWWVGPNPFSGGTLLETFVDQHTTAPLGRQERMRDAQEKKKREQRGRVGRDLPPWLR